MEQRSSTFSDFQFNSICVWRQTKRRAEKDYNLGVFELQMTNFFNFKLRVKWTIKKDRTSHSDPLPIVYLLVVRYVVVVIVDQIEETKFVLKQTHSCSASTLKSVLSALSFSFQCFIEIRKPSAADLYRCLLDDDDADDDDGEEDDDGDDAADDDDLQTSQFQWQTFFHFRHQSFLAACISISYASAQHLSLAAKKAMFSPFCIRVCEEGAQY